jgi:hypothetical protein
VSVDDDARAGRGLRVAPAPPEVDAARTLPFRRALAAVARVFAANEHRGDAWRRRETPYSHVTHARAHLEVWTESRRLEDLEHAAVRALMALELARAEAEA